VTGKRKICVVTGTRADYGLLQGLLRILTGADGVELQLVATGMHLSSEFGLTVRQIEADGFGLGACVEMLVSSDTPTGIAKSMGLGTIGFGETLARLSPDILVVLGDRFEILAAVQAALVARIPIAHIHGGEITEGAFDDSIRHAITKMAQWHFVAAEPYRKRVIQMGESPDRVFVTGAPGLDHLRDMVFLDRRALEVSLGMRLGSPLFLVTYHPATLGSDDPLLAQGELLGALDRFPDASIVFTYPNADPGGRDLSSQLEAWVSKNGHRAKSFISLGQQRYLSLMCLADAVIGNSSSGIIEAPALKRATVNVGDRQKGRLRADSIVDVPEDRVSIEAGIRKSLTSDFQRGLTETVSLYGEGGASERISQILTAVALTDRKLFFDMQIGF
jgi:UDP-hydrolysing UDP-N-acetyl-D-glucosamine 2-epimerase